MFEDLKKWLSSQGVRFQEVSHGITRTSEEAALARGIDLSLGGKALVIKVDDEFKLFVLSASRQLDSKAIKSNFP